jgi:hypothetical protein
MTANPDEIYRQIKVAIEVALAGESVAPSRIAICEQPNLDLNSRWFVQIRPSGGSGTVPRVGPMMVDDRVEIISWQARNSDVGGKRTILLSDDTKSLLTRQRLIRAALQNSFLSGLLEVPLRLVTHTIPTESVEAVGGFIRSSDVYAMSYEVGTGLVYARMDEDTADLTGNGLQAVGDPLTLLNATETSAYTWFLIPSTFGEPTFWSESGQVPFYSNANVPPSGPTCSTQTIGGVQYREFRSPYPTLAQSATYRVRRG